MRDSRLPTAQRNAVYGARRQIVRLPEAPRLCPKLAHYEVADDQAGPIEITVITKSRTGGGELREQRLRGGGGHAVRTHQGAQADPRRSAAMATTLEFSQTNTSRWDTAQAGGRRNSLRGDRCRGSPGSWFA
jgi:hypothetical protein